MLVKETNAGRKVSAYIILKFGRQCGKIQAAEIAPGKVLINLWDKDSLLLETSGESLDKAIHGFNFEGTVLYEECWPFDEPEKWLNQYVAACDNNMGPGRVVEKAKEAGFLFRNWSVKENRWLSCHPMTWDDRLRAHGYQVIQAI